MTSPRLLTTKEVAAQAKVSVRTVSRWAATGALLPIQKLPGATGAYLFRADDVDRFLAEQAA